MAIMELTLQDRGWQLQTLEQSRLCRMCGPANSEGWRCLVHRLKNSRSTFVVCVFAWTLNYAMESDVRCMDTSDPALCVYSPCSFY